MLGLLVLAGRQLSAVTLTDPALFAPDYASNAKITQSSVGATSAAALDAVSGFWVVRDYTGFTDGANSIAFTPSELPGLSISFGGGVHSSSGSEITNAGFLTSGTSGVRIQAGTTNATTVTGLIDFTGGTATAAAFTLAGNRFDRVSLITVVFLSETNAILSTQTYAGTGASSTIGLYFGHAASGSQSIGSIAISIELNAGGTTAIFGLDDIGFAPAPVPEPAAAAAWLGTVGLLAATVRRPRR